MLKGLVIYQTLTRPALQSHKTVQLTMNNSNKITNNIGINKFSNKKRRSLRGKMIFNRRGKKIGNCSNKNNLFKRN
jgi:hypothetical protein